ncbi:MAG TPA: nuclear transport factor 2 family protein, partial [Polyangiales bacterium]
NGDTLEELRFNSPWCRGFDARFVYRRVPTAPFTRDEIIRRYAAHWNRRDAHAVAGLFSENGLLIEPFTRSNDGAPVRHEGRTDIESWFARAFASTPWLALQLDRIEALNDRGEALAVWRYADARLAEPLAGRNLFLLAGGEIFTSELQLLAEPAPRAQGAAAMTGSQAP